MRQNYCVFEIKDPREEILGSENIHVKRSKVYETILCNTWVVPGNFILSIIGYIED